MQDINSALEHYSLLDKSFKNKIKYLIPDSLRNKIHPRKFHCFCIGAPKSGTTSIAGLFNKYYRSSHEPERRAIIYFMNDHFKGLKSDHEYMNWLKIRDKRVWLDMESNCFLGYRIDLLIRAFPNSKFILSIREPLSWLDSMINHTINYPPTSEEVIRLWHSIYFLPEKYPHTSKDQVLKQYNVYSLEAYLRYWSHSIKSVLENIPSKQLLTVKTNEFEENKLSIAQFLNIPESSLDFKSSHLNKAPRKYNLLSKIDREFIHEQRDKYCGELIEQFNL